MFLGPITYTDMTIIQEAIAISFDQGTPSMLPLAMSELFPQCCLEHQPKHYPSAALSIDQEGSTFGIVTCL